MSNVKGDVSIPIQGVESIAPTFNIQDEQPMRIKKINFGLLSSVDMHRLSEMTMQRRDLYNVQSRDPCPFGPLDRRLGTSAKLGICETCNRGLTDCVGHFGVIDLSLPVFHIGYFTAVKSILERICKSCSRVLVSDALRKEALHTLRTTKSKAVRKEMLATVDYAAKKSQICSHCLAYNGSVKKTGPLKLQHEAYGAPKKETGKSASATAQQQRAFRVAQQLQPDLTLDLVAKAGDDLNPLRVLQLFEAMPDDDCALLGLAPEHARPENLIMTSILVPPVCLRPSIATDASMGTTEDDLTVQLSSIVQISNAIGLTISRGVATNAMAEDWNYLQLLAATYVNSDTPGMQAQFAARKRYRSLCQRLKGKTGRFRGNLSGKRVDFSSRTVISPDPNLGVDEVAVPERVAKILTFPEMVTEHNIEQLRDCIRRGVHQRNGANFIIRDNNPRFKKSLARLTDLEGTAAKLQIGDVVERHLRDGDVVLFNRQPSLHRISIMAHRARVMPGRTFRFNECVCTPYNADFDGDEMNLHVPQTYEAVCEAWTLMSVTNNLVTPRTGDVLVAATQDFISAAYMISHKDTFYTHSQFTQLCMHMLGPEMNNDWKNQGVRRIVIPIPAILKPVALWTGKQVFSTLLRPYKDSKYSVALEAKGKTFDGKASTHRAALRGTKRDENPHMCPNDGFVVVRASEVLCGVLDKATLGSSDKANLFLTLLRDASAEFSALCMARLARLCARQIGALGFSIGIEDVTPSPALVLLKNNLMSEGYAKCDEEIRKFRDGELEQQPGCDMSQTLEQKLTGILGGLRQAAGQLCIEMLPPRNSALIMAQSGSKGSLINISQMVACVGQQQVGGERIQNGFDERTLPHFGRHSRTPAAKGFVANSFYSGLEPTEFFFHTMGGREGLVDTAVKTAETGYLQRKMMKSLEDLSVSYDRTVRTGDNSIVQLQYGDDSLDPINMEMAEQPVDFERQMMRCQSTYVSRDKRVLRPHALQRLAVAAARRVEIETESGRFARDLLAFLVAPPNMAFAYASKFSKEGSLLSRALDARPFLNLVTITVSKSISFCLKHLICVTQTEKQNAVTPKPLQFRTLQLALGWLQETVEFVGLRKSNDSDSSTIRYKSKTISYDKSSLFEESFGQEKVKTFAKCIEIDCLDEVNDYESEILTLSAAVESDKNNEFVFNQIKKAVERDAVPCTLPPIFEDPYLQSLDGDYDDNLESRRGCQVEQVTREQLLRFVSVCIDKYRRARIEAGTAVGALAAQSIGEPATQMTLKTFHFAGVASMNITLGVPRVKEILNASKNIKTPIVTAKLDQAGSLLAARAAQGRIETTTLRDVCSKMQVVIAKDCWNSRVQFRLDLKTIENLMVEVTATSIMRAIVDTSSLKLQPSDVGKVLQGDGTVWIFVRPSIKLHRHLHKVKVPRSAHTEDNGTVPVDWRNNARDALLHLLEMVPNIIIAGIPAVSRAVINQSEENGETKYELLCEGAALQEVMGVSGVVGTATTCNHIFEVSRALGIEAARVSIEKEVKRTMDAYGVRVDARHLMLLADLMTARGEVLGITRFGVAKMKDSVLMLASFEKTTDHLFKAALYGESDSVEGVSESIIMGVPVPLGTGALDTVTHTTLGSSHLSPPHQYSLPHHSLRDIFL